MGLKFSLTFLIFFSFSYALKTFTVNFKGKQLLLTKEVPKAFFGYYFSKSSNNRSAFVLSKKFKESYQIWIDRKRKDFFEWGILVKDNKLFQTDQDDKPSVDIEENNYVLVRRFYSGKVHFGLLIEKKELKSQISSYIFDHEFIKKTDFSLK